MYVATNCIPDDARTPPIASITHILPRLRRTRFPVICRRNPFNTHFTSKVEIVLPELDVKKIKMWDFHVDYLQDYQRYGIIVGRGYYLK